MILLLGGTQEGRQIASLLKENNYNFLLSTVSDYGSHLAQSVSKNIQAESLDETGLIELCAKKKITKIIDATHPFATNISVTAIETAKRLKIPYLRYERETVPLPKNNPYIHIVKNHLEACQLAGKLGNKILLTIGSRQIESYSELIKDKQVFVRILPDLDSLRKCCDIGIKPSQIIALQGPFTKDFNRALYMEKNIEIVITKDSGPIGGADAKVAACLELQIPIIIIKRPDIKYPVKVDGLRDVLKFLQGENYGVSN